MKRVIFTLLFCGILLFSCSTSKNVKQTVETEKDTQVTELYSRIDDLSNRVYVLTEQVETLRSKLKDSPVVPQTNPETVVIQPVKKQVQTKQDKIQKDYNYAYEQYSTKKYSKALLAFSEFIEKYPDTYLTDHAMYWLGESYFNQKEYALASDEYIKVLKKFPKGSKAPFAMLRLAQCYKNLGMEPESKSYVEELVKRFPNSRAVEEAKDI